MDGHALLKQVMKKIMRELDQADYAYHDESPEDVAERIVWILDDIRTVNIDGREKVLSYDEERDSVYYVRDVTPLGWTVAPHDGPIYHTDTEGNVLKTEASDTPLAEAVPPWREDEDPGADLYDMKSGK